MAIKQNTDATQDPGTVNPINTTSNNSSLSNMSLNSNKTNGGYAQMCEENEGVNDGMMEGSAGGDGGGGDDPIGEGCNDNRDEGAASLLNNNKNGLQDSPLKANPSAKMASPSNHKLNNIDQMPEAGYTHKDINQLLQLIEMVKYRQCSLGQNELLNIYNFILMELAHVEVPQTNVSEFKEKIRQVGQFFLAANDKRLHLYFLRVVYQIITKKPGATPSGALAIIFQLFDGEMILEAVHSLMDMNIPDEDVKRTVAILNHWLRASYFCKNLHLWIIALLTEVKSRNKLDLFNTISLKIILDVFSSVILPILRPKVGPLVFHILVNVTDTPEVFHSIIPKYPTVLASLKAQAQMKESVGSDAKDFLEKLVEISRALMVRFYGYDELYKNLDDQLKDLGPSYNYLNCVQLPLKQNDMFEEVPEGSKSKVGLVNLGNTCYMNSILQALAMTKDFSREILLTKCDSPLIIQMQQLIALMLYSLRYELTPSQILNSVRPPNFVIGLQQDSSEYLSYLLDTLHEHELISRPNYVDNNRRFDIQEYEEEKSAGTSLLEDNNMIGEEVFWDSPEPICSLDPPSTDDSEVSNCTIVPMDYEQSDETFLNDLIEQVDKDDHDLSEPIITLAPSSDSSVKTNTSSSPTSSGSFQPSKKPKLAEEPSTIDKTFTGKSIITITCFSCGWQSRNIDSFRDLQLAIPEEKSNTNCSVQDLLDFYSSPEKLEDDNQYFCDNCRTLTDAERTINFISAPKNLILTLKHFKYDSRHHMRAKLIHKIYHDEKVFLKISTDGYEKTIIYDLYAGVVHSGINMDSGHYYTYAADGSNQWYKFDDSAVTPSDSEEMHNLGTTNTPYILFYRMSGQTLDSDFSNIPSSGTSTSSMNGTFEGCELIPRELAKPLKMEELPIQIRSFIINDNNAYVEEVRAKRYQLFNQYWARDEDNVIRRDNYDDDDDMPPQGGGCGDNTFDVNVNRFVY